MDTRQPSNLDLQDLLSRGEIQEFNRRRPPGPGVDLRGLYLRGVDLRGLDSTGLDLRDAYLRQTDLRGLDLRSTQLEGASLYGARISGVYFPDNLAAEEINLSLVHGTRLRCR